MECSLEKLRIRKSMELAFVSQKSLSFKDSMKKINPSKEVKKILMGSIKDTLSMEKEKATVLFSGIMDKNFKEIGKMESSVDLVFGGLPGETIMRVNGATIGNKVKACLNIKLALIKESL